MALPVRLELGFHDLDLPGGPFAVRVFRLEASLAVGGSGGVYAVATPVAVVDRSGERPRWQPVLDPAFVAPIIAVFAAALGLIARRQSRKTTS